jgi:glycosyltransferase involved in cell wall biosynthesis
LTCALRILLDDPEATLAMCREAERDMKDRWNWERYIEQLVQLYQQVQCSSA